MGGHPGLGVPEEQDTGEEGTTCKHKTHGDVTQLGGPIRQQVDSTVQGLKIQTYKVMTRMKKNINVLKLKMMT